ncbi:hypothetical protein N8I74_09290 [Chitiniphilus purpureus]|uniref:Uncharacterized protein n=1 Tax=Chitiniphilus purpureus TaxID=2981137 RepID=A0ABY6DS41_9NEIS|nr:hypothetical protein [Chitiniphilus sp. CD1]UXY17180.1 hypothetical protein N8I74_09290 [Chitiniphilus sp. CD1]
MPGPTLLVAPADLLSRLAERLDRMGLAPDVAASTIPDALPDGALVLAVALNAHELDRLGGFGTGSGVDLIDIALLADHAAAVEHGWMLAVGANAPSVARARHWLDALAPAPGGWLCAGGLGAGVFLAQLARYWSLLHHDVLAWLAERGPCGTASFDLASWQVEASRQWPALHGAARDYLAGAATQPAGTEGIAVTLARIIVQNSAETAAQQ